MTRLLPLLFALLLPACTMQAQYDKRVPADVQAAIDAQIDQLVAGDSAAIIEAFAEDAADPAFREQIGRMIANVPEAAETSRDVVGVQARTEQAYSVTDGAVRSGVYNSAHELSFANGKFLLVQLAYTLDERGKCCTLRGINAVLSEDSPVRAQQVRQGRIMRVVAVLLVVSTLITLVVFLIRVGGRKARAAQMGARR